MKGVIEACPKAQGKTGTGEHGAKHWTFYPQQRNSWCKRPCHLIVRLGQSTRPPVLTAHQN
eukprot:495535-Pelagomonas_calceolata.AAC.3